METWIFFFLIFRKTVETPRQKCVNIQCIINPSRRFYICRCVLLIFIVLLYYCCGSSSPTRMVIRSWQRQLAIQRAVQSALSETSLLAAVIGFFLLFAFIFSFFPFFLLGYRQTDVCPRRDEYTTCDRDHYIIYYYYYYITRCDDAYYCCRRPPHLLSADRWRLYDGAMNGVVRRREHK